MASIINATTTGLTVTPDNSGQLTLSANGVTALTANTTGYLNFAKQPQINGGEWPVFSAYRSGSSHNITGAVWTKVQFNSEFYDPTNCFDTSNYRFTPNVAGYYQVNLMCEFSWSGTSTVTGVAVFKNATAVSYSTVLYVSMSSSPAISTSILVYLNGSTDYIDAYAYSTGATSPVITTSSIFQGFLARAA